MPNNLYNPLASTIGLAPFGSPLAAQVNDLSAAQTAISGSNLLTAATAPSGPANPLNLAQALPSAAATTQQADAGAVLAAAPLVQPNQASDQLFVAMQSLSSADALFAANLGNRTATANNAMAALPSTNSSGDSGASSSSSNGTGNGPEANGLPPSQNPPPAASDSGSGQGLAQMASMPPPGSGSGGSQGYGNASFNWTPVGPSHPWVTNPGQQSGVEGNTASLQVSATDPQHFSLTYDAVGLPLGLSINQTSGLISGVIDSRAAIPGNGAYVPTVIARNSLGVTASQTFNWTVAPTGLPPVLTSLVNQTNSAGDTVSLQAVATDPDGNPLYFGASGLPAGVFMDTNSGLISGTIDPSLPSSSYAATVTVSDLNKTTTCNITWSVAGHPEPILNTLGNQTNVEGDVVSLQVVATDPNGATLGYTADGLPAGLAIDSTSGLITGTIAAGASVSASNGSGTVTVAASNDSFATSASTSLTWSVVPYVSVSPVPNQVNNEGDAVSLTVTASAPAGVVGFTATNLPPGLTIDPASGVISGTIAAGAAQAGSYPVQVTVADGSYATITKWTWGVGRVSTAAPTISNPGNQTSALGSAASVSLAASDANGDVITYTATGLPPGLLIDPTAGTIFGFFDKDDIVQPIPYQVAVTADNGHGGTATANFSWTVTDSALTATGAAPISGLEGAAIQNVLLATATDAAFYRSSGDYTALVNWGDGSYLDPGVLTGQKGALNVYDSHTYSRPGTYTVQVTVYDPDNTAVTTTTSATVTAVAITALGAPVNDVAPAFESPRPVAYFTDANPLESVSSYTASIDWGDGTPASSGPVSVSQGRITVSGNHYYAQSGPIPYTTNVTLTDDDGSSAHVTGSVKVGDYYAGQPLIADVGWFAGAGSPATSATFFWGDGTTSVGSILNGSPYGFTLRGDHTYVTDGYYHVVVTASAGSTTWGADTYIQVVLPPVDAFAAPIPTNLASSYGNQLVATASDRNPYFTGTYQAAIDWSDGSVTSGTVSASNGFVHVAGSHAYGQAVVNPLAVEIFRRNDLQTVQFQLPLDVPQIFPTRSVLASTLENNFKAWTKGRPTLKSIDIDTLLDDPTIQGQDAAALAVLKAFVMDLQGDKRDKLSGNVNLFMANSQGWSPKTDGLTIDNIKYFIAQFVPGQPLFPTALALQSRFDTAFTKIGKKSKVLFREDKNKNEQPNFDSVQQGMLGDCAFLAAVDARVFIYKTKFRDRFKEIPAANGNPRTFKVTFGRIDGRNLGTTVEVTEPTDAQIALYASAGQGGLWLSVIEKAYVTYLNANPALPWLGFQNASAYEAVSSGQLLQVPIEILGGYKVIPYETENLTVEQLAKLIDDASTARATVTLGTKPSNTFDPTKDLPGGHAYSVLGGVQRDTKLVYIRNPWGNNGGTIRFGGGFTMTPAQIKAKFQFLAVEAP